MQRPKMKQILLRALLRQSYKALLQMKSVCAVNRHPRRTRHRRDLSKSTTPSRQQLLELKFTNVIPEST